MPLYEYECKQCHERLEKIQSFSALPEKICPKCGGELERVISAPAFQFKGAGWYVNDYAKSGAKKTPASGEDKSDSSTESKSDGKSDGKTDGKNAGKSSGESAPASASSSNSSSEGSSGGNETTSSKPAASPSGS